MTTVRELSKKLGVSKTAILKYAKEELQLTTEPRKALQITASQCAVIADHFSDVKQEVCKENARTENLELQTSVQLSANQIFSLQAENAALRERVSGLEEQVSMLRERLEVADAALEREQMQARGFWSRLGQKLLPGAGK